MIGKPLSDITLEDILSLVEASRMEDQTIEYKSTFPGSGDDKSLIVKTACAFANTHGGDIVVGVEAREGVPVAVPGVEIDDPDARILGLGAQVRESVEPPLSAPQIRAIPVSPGRFVIVARVERSWARPHRVRRGNEFYARGPGGNYALDLESVKREIRSLGAVQEHARAFQVERVAAALGGETAVKLSSGPVLLVHVCPVSALLEGEWTIGPKDWELSRNGFFPPLNPGSTYSFGYHADGYLVYETPREDGSRASSLLFRNGLHELACSVRANTDTLAVHAPTIEAYIKESLEQTLRSLTSIGLAPPFLTSVSLVGAKGYRLLTGDMWEEPSRSFDRDTYLFPWRMIPNSSVDAFSAMRSSVDALWNAVGLLKKWPKEG